jgi:hypothetical protein
MMGDWFKTLMLLFPWESLKIVCHIQKDWSITTSKMMDLFLSLFWKLTLPIHLVVLPSIMQIHDLQTFLGILGIHWLELLFMLNLLGSCKYIDWRIVVIFCMNCSSQTFSFPFEMHYPYKQIWWNPISH